MLRKEFKRQYRTNKFALTLTAIDKYNSDILGNIYKTKGRLCFENWICNRDPMTGYLGILWGNPKLSTWQHAKPTCWLVIRIAMSPENVILVLEDQNLVKFKEGNIMFCGDLDSSLHFIGSRKSDPLQLFLTLKR